MAGALVVAVAFTGLDELLTIIAVLLQALFFVYFIRHLAFAITTMRSGVRDLDTPILSTGFGPLVSVLVACKNEESVVDNLVASLVALDYPPDLLEIIIVDDGSVDRTGERLDALAARVARVRVVHRPEGAGGAKSAALNDGVRIANGEIVVVFDADHQPHRDVIRRLVRHFEDPTVGAVQGRCVINNPQDSPLTRLVAIDYLAGYLVNEYGRQWLFELPAYGGANCAVRTSSLREAGGWNVRTVTEDTDLTLRLILAGQRVRYDVSAVDAEEGVVTLTRYWRQRYRWARGHQQVWRDYRHAVWASPRLSLTDKVETSMFLFGFHLPVASALGMVILGIWGSGLARPADPLNTFILWTLLFLGPLLELAAGLLAAKSDRREAIALAFFLPLFFVSVALCTKAWFDGIVGRPYTWVKTQRAADTVLEFP